MSTVHADLPAGVAALGEPEQVFTPTKGTQATNVLVAIALAGVGLLLLVFALWSFGKFSRPAGVKGPAPEILLISCIGGAIAGCVALGAAAWFGSAAAACSQTYLLYKDAIVELFPDRHRVIFWNRIGEPKPVVPLVSFHRFPVEDENELRFNYTVTDHAVLAKTIAARAAESRLVADLGGEAALAKLEIGVAAPYFLARKASYLETDPLYRVSILGNSLLFIQVGAGYMSDKPTNAGAGGGLMSMAASAPVWRMMKFRANMQRLEGADERELIRLAAEMDGSFVLSAADLHEPRIDPPSAWSILSPGRPHVGVLKLSHAKKGKLKLQLLTHHDVLEAAKGLRSILQDAVSVNIT